ncbi:unnamed protein product [Acanthoscelides obtectus]|uniref:Uncharacterized protein n=1 Tax=Acanthoscelides obtectus TaxID=200917 RepID=A0A9P0M6Q6_ACAOB|nr:unnamed protein product [Acanthoscelides obtectus]CAK1677273.1 hypothetical protein AOBTE_LOCUS31220 [Acanthoscelides obtectus]
MEILAKSDNRVYFSMGTKVFITNAMTPWLNIDRRIKHPIHKIPSFMYSKDKFIEISPSLRFVVKDSIRECILSLMPGSLISFTFTFSKMVIEDLLKESEVDSLVAVGLLSISETVRFLESSPSTAFDDLISDILSATVAGASSADLPEMSNVSPKLTLVEFSSAIFGDIERDFLLTAISGTLSWSVLYQKLQF